MAVIQSQLEFHNSYLKDARTSNYGESSPFGGNFQIDTYSFGLAETTISSLGDARINSYVQPSLFGMSFQADTYYLGLTEAAISYFNYCVVGWTSLLPLTKGIGVQDYFSSHARFFGVNFRQDTDNIYIKKTELPSLKSTSNNTAQSLLVALLLRILIYESNDLISLINIYKWETDFVKINQDFFVLARLVIEVNVPVKYKYVNVEIINANDSLSPNEL